MNKYFENQVCIVIPIYKKSFNKQEEQAVKLNLKKLLGIKAVFVGPIGIVEDYYRTEFSEVDLVLFPRYYFKGISGYNKLMLYTGFYQMFIEYKYICICQPDALILKEKSDLKRIIDLDYDYIGAAWQNDVKFCIWDKRYDVNKKTAVIKRKIREIRHKFFKTYTLVVGNGGLSLRKVETCKRLLEDHIIYKFFWRENEDKFFAFVGEYKDAKFKMADKNVADSFSLEHLAKEKITKGNIPYGIHAYDRYYPNVIDEHPEFWS